MRWGLTRRRGNTKAEMSGAEWNRLMRYAYQYLRHIAIY
ncbi:hypothetical protein ECDEC8A_4805 [Escherichia coli DEC8A]|nr:hypothetical protein ECDEC8A_4805 [Escherichia coli DEC8A]EHW06400.1 hypothetical protein ECDEC8B_4640 [Escherichia coli DEC8B]